MQYRRFPHIDDVEVSALGFGCMRLPTVGGERRCRSTRRPSRGCSRLPRKPGSNYLDTAYVYHRQASETALGAALERSGKRDKFYLATKSPVWLAKDKSDWEKLLDKQLARLRTDHIDFYLLHSLGAESWAKCRELGALPALERAKAAGKIRHIGFSFHDSIDSFKEIIDGYDAWEFCQVQYNYVDRDFQAGEAGLAYAAEREIGVIVMEPLRGGALAAPPPQVKKALAAYPTPRIPYEWALAVRPGSTGSLARALRHGIVEPDLGKRRGCIGCDANSLTAKERAILDEARSIYMREAARSLHHMRLLPALPHGAGYSRALRHVQRGLDVRYAKGNRRLVQGPIPLVGAGADACIRCGECLPKCPQGIAIPDRLEETHAYLTAE